MTTAFDDGRGFTLVDLGPWYNNDAISTASRPDDGGFNVWGNTYPAEELPAGPRAIHVGRVPFTFPPSGDGHLNTVVCLGQSLPIPAGLYDWLYLLAASERRTEDEVYLHYADGTADPEWLRVSDFWPAPPHFGEVLAFRVDHAHYPRHVQAGVRLNIWRQRVPVPRACRLSAVRLPDNPAIHIFAATLELSRDSER